MRIRSVHQHCLTGIVLLAAFGACTCPPAKKPTPGPGVEAGSEATAAEPGQVQPQPPAETPATPAPTETTPADTGALPVQGQPCAEDGRCAEGLTCLGYYGIAGRAGPELHSCEIPCGEGHGSCPQGQQCATIADGPGQVCRPAPTGAPAR